MENNESIPVYKREKTDIEDGSGENTALRRDLFNAIREAYFNKCGSVFVEPGELETFINMLKSPRINEMLDGSLYMEIKMDSLNFWDRESSIDFDNLCNNLTQFSFESLEVDSDGFAKRSERANIIASAVALGQTKVMREIIAFVGSFEMGNFPDRAEQLNFQ